mmetsp:Transcript_46177/g.90181  ORF Transcript_46177/g.90181 Transcript_46177/m.90181 type:complete len:225 (-) Transcript_46177:181-855(-)
MNKKLFRRPALVFSFTLLSVSRTGANSKIELEIDATNSIITTETPTPIEDETYYPTYYPTFYEPTYLPTYYPTFYSEAPGSTPAPSQVVLTEAPVQAVVVTEPPEETEPPVQAVIVTEPPKETETGEERPPKETETVPGEERTDSGREGGDTPVDTPIELPVAVVDPTEPSVVVAEPTEPPVEVVEPTEPHVEADPEEEDEEEDSPGFLKKMMCYLFGWTGACE